MNMRDIYDNRQGQRRRALRMVILSLAIGMAAPHSYAHSDAHFDTQVAPHGGRMRMAGPVHLELVIDAGRIVLFVTDHAEQAQASAGGAAAVRFPEQGLRVALTASGDNTFSAPLPPGLAAGGAAIVFVKLPGIEAQSARFKARAAASPAPSDLDHAHH